MVCLGNICRSPMADGIFSHKVSERNLSSKIQVDSAGMISMHQGENPDFRAVSTCRKHGVDISKLIARPFTTNDFDDFDFIFVMDKSNYRDVIAMARNEDDKQKVHLLLNYSNPGSNAVVPDPYYGGMEDFEAVYKLLNDACETVLEKLIK